MISSTSLIVSQSGQGHFAAIGEAVRNARPGSSILVRPGVYEEYIILDKPLKIIGDGTKEDIIVRCAVSNCILMLADSAYVSNLTLQGTSGTTGNGKFAVNITSGQLQLEDCEITSDALSGVAIHGPTTAPILRRCKISCGNDSGVFVFNNGRGLIEECEISDNQRHGVMITQGGNPVINRCTITRNRANGIYASTDGMGRVEDCDLTGNKDGAWFMELGGKLQRIGNQE